MSNQQRSEIQLRPWAEGDLWLLQGLLGDPAMMTYLGGPESPEKIRSRHEMYCKIANSGDGGVFVITVGPEMTPAGSVVYWATEHDGEDIWETGWSVLPEFQGQNLAALGVMAMLERVRAAGRYRYLHASPGVDNGPSNGVCRKASFTLMGEFDGEYPPGHYMRFNDWRLDLHPEWADAETS